MKNAGPKRLSGHGRGWKYGPTTKILAKGITDMVRISDARMSGTAYGTVVYMLPLKLWRVGLWL